MVEALAISLKAAGFSLDVVEFFSMYLILPTSPLPQR
jgi:hypothetical protein